jgi:hypothetical protein
VKLVAKKLEAMVPSKDAVVLNNWTSCTESHETTVAQQPFHVTLCMASNLKQRHEIIVSSIMKPIS